MIQGQLPRADRVYAQVLALNPLSPRVVTDLAHLRGAEGREQDAERLYREALGLEPKLFINHAELALLALQRGDLTTAQREASLEPLADYRDLAGTLIAFRTGERHAAELALQKFIQKNAADSPYLVARAYA